MLGFAEVEFQLLYQRMTKLQYVCINVEMLRAIIVCVVVEETQSQLSQRICNSVFATIDSQCLFVERGEEGEGRGQRAEGRNGVGANREFRSKNLEGDETDFVLRAL